jgi:hypothetical protein
LAAWAKNTAADREADDDEDNMVCEASLEEVYTKDKL